MSRSKALYGTSKDAYFRRLLRAEPGLGREAGERILRRLQAEVVQVRLRESGATAGEFDPAGENAPDEACDRSPAAATFEPAFDPFSPNVVVIIRTAGREGALSALAGIDRVEQLRALAREQQLSIDASAETAADLRSAIIAAAERRIANRRAAAG